MYTSWLLFAVLVYETLIHTGCIYTNGRRTESVVLSASLQSVTQALWYTLFAQLWNVLCERFFCRPSLVRLYGCLAHKINILMQQVIAGALTRRQVVLILILLSQFVSCVTFHCCATVLIIFLVCNTTTDGEERSRKNCIGVSQVASSSHEFVNFLLKKMMARPDSALITVEHHHVNKDTEPSLTFASLDGTRKTYTDFTIKIVRDTCKFDWVTFDQDFFKNGTHLITQTRPGRDRQNDVVCWQQDDTTFVLIQPAKCGMAADQGATTRWLM